MSLTITTNNRPRTLLTLEDLTEAERGDFDYVTDSEELRFIRAYGQVLDTHEFESIQRGISVPVVAPSRHDKGSLSRWNEIQPGSSWHAIVLRWFDSEGYELEGPVAGWAQW